MHQLICVNLLLQQNENHKSIGVYKHLYIYTFNGIHNHILEEVKMKLSMVKKQPPKPHKNQFRNEFQ